MLAERLNIGKKQKKWTENIVNEMMCQKDTEIMYWDWFWQWFELKTRIWFWVGV